ncbi:MAG: hypothetical protein EXR98_06160 [Gemmataceae bacterium]|nr:hypothetical protein [Gemmataceae bacterium]
MLLAALAGCRVIEREGANPLPENTAPLAYSDMVNRARGQASSALDAFYVDAWLDLEQAAQRLEQTARLLPKTTQIPEAFKSKVETESDLLRKDATKLLEAAHAKNAPQANEAMQRINQRVRELRAQEKVDEKK